MGLSSLEVFGNVIANLICGCISCDDTDPYRDEALPADDQKWNRVLAGSEMRSKKTCEHIGADPT